MTEEERPLLRSIQFTDELNQFLKLVVQSKAKTALEIGAAQCGTAMALAWAMGKDSRVVSVDLPVEQDGTPKFCEDEAKRLLGDQFTLVRGYSTSYSTIAAVREALGDRPVDILFIDAEHTEEAALCEYKTYRPLLSENGMTAFHDICMDNLWPMWNRLRAQKRPDRSIEIIRDIRQHVCGIGVLLGR